MVAGPTSQRLKNVLCVLRAQDLEDCSLKCDQDGPVSASRALPLWGSGLSICRCNVVCWFGIYICATRSPGSVPGKSDVPSSARTSTPLAPPLVSPQGRVRIVLLGLLLLK